MYPRIRDMREDSDVKQVNLAAYLNVKQSTYSRYETGVLDIPSQSLIKLARFYQASLDYLLGQSNVEGCAMISCGAAQRPPPTFSGKAPTLYIDIEAGENHENAAKKIEKLC